MENIAIFDPCNQDISLKLLFPEADYYIEKVEIDRSEAYKRFSFQPLKNPSLIAEGSYDYLFVIFPIELMQKNPELKNIVEGIVELTQKKSFKKIGKITPNF